MVWMTYSYVSDFMDIATKKSVLDAEDTWLFKLDDYEEFNSLNHEVML